MLIPPSRGRPGRPGAPAGQDVRAVATSLTWLGERLSHLAAAGVPPFDDEDTLVAALLHIWVHTRYGTIDG